VYDSYGKKCNHRFFLNYGFINLNNDANEFPFKIYYNDDEKFLQVKKELIGDSADFKKFRVVANLEERIMHEFLSWLRFVEYDENLTLIQYYKGAAISAA
jgi:histone-lysine N-methyltransferase SETD3